MCFVVFYCMMLYGVLFVLFDCLCGLLLVVCGLCAVNVRCVCLLNQMCLCAVWFTVCRCMVCDCLCLLCLCGRGV